MRWIELLGNAFSEWAANWVSYSCMMVAFLVLYICSTFGTFTFIMDTKSYLYLIHLVGCVTSWCVHAWLQESEGWVVHWLQYLQQSPYQSHHIHRGNWVWHGCMWTEGEGKEHSGEPVRQDGCLPHHRPPVEPEVHPGQAELGRDLARQIRWCQMCYSAIFCNYLSLAINAWGLALRFFWSNLYDVFTATRSCVWSYSNSWCGSCHNARRSGEYALLVTLSVCLISFTLLLLGILTHIMP